MKLSRKVGGTLVRQKNGWHAIMHRLDQRVRRAGDHAEASTPLGGILPDASSPQEILGRRGEAVGALPTRRPRPLEIGVHGDETAASGKGRAPDGTSEFVIPGIHDGVTPSSIKAPTHGDDLVSRQHDRRGIGGAHEAESLIGTGGVLDEKVAISQWGELEGCAHERGKSIGRTSLNDSAGFGRLLPGAFGDIGSWILKFSRTWRVWVWSGCLGDSSRRRSGAWGRSRLG